MSDTAYVPEPAATSRSQRWTAADHDLLVRLRRDNSLLEPPALTLLFNGRASAPRTVTAIKHKLKAIAASEGDRSGAGGDAGPSRTLRKRQEDETDGEEQDEELASDSEGDMSEVSTVPSTGDGKQDELHPTRSRSRSPSRPPIMPPRHTAARTPPTPRPRPSSAQPAPAQPRQQHTAKKPKTHHGHAKPGGVTELQAIETQRILVEHTAKLAEMEQSYLRRQGGGD